MRVKFYCHFIYKPISYGRRFYFGSHVRIRKHSLVVGYEVYLGNYCHISVPKVIIGDYTMLASYVSIVGNDYITDRSGIPMAYTGKEFNYHNQSGVIIGKDVWIGHGAVIMDGVKIGDGSIIGSNSVVTKDIAPFSIYGGVPARFIRKRFQDISQENYHKSMLKQRHNIKYFWKKIK